MSVSTDNKPTEPHVCIVPGCGGLFATDSALHEHVGVCAFGDVECAQCKVKMARGLLAQHEALAHRTVKDALQAEFRQQQKKKELMEPLFKPSIERFTLFPIKDPEFWKMYKKAEAAMWHVAEVDLGNDLKDWNTLNAGEQHFIKMVLAFFASSDTIVVENLALRFLRDVQSPEARCFYGFQLMMENIHSEMYGLMLETYISDSVEKQKLFRAIETVPVIAKKAEWAMRYINNDNVSAVERIVAFACVEGIFFSGAFCSIFWLKKRGKMPGLTFSNELISRDESAHCSFAISMYRQLQNRLSQEQVENIVREAVEIEQFFVSEALPVELIGMNSSDMKSYVAFVSDHLLDALGHDKIYGVQNPFDWMELISLPGRSDFFSRRVGEYQLPNVLTHGLSQLNLGQTRAASQDEKDAINPETSKTLKPVSYVSEVDF